MKRILLAAIAVCMFGIYASGQQLHEAFKKEPELMQAIKTYDFTKLTDEPVAFEFDTIQMQVDAAVLNQLLKQYMALAKQQQIRKAAEANHGYVQTMGLYDKKGDALMYIKFEFNPINSKLTEVVIQRN